MFCISCDKLFFVSATSPIKNRLEGGTKCIISRFLGLVILYLCTGVTVQSKLEHFSSLELSNIHALHSKYTFNIH